MSEKQSGGIRASTSINAAILSFVALAATPSVVFAACLTGALAVSLSAQDAVADDIQRVETADVDAAPDTPVERRVCLNRSAYVLAVQGDLRTGTFHWDIPLNST